METKKNPKEFKPLKWATTYEYPLVIAAIIFIWVWNAGYLAYFSYTHSKNIFGLEKSPFLEGFMRDETTDPEWVTFETNLPSSIIYTILFSAVSYFIKLVCYKYQVPDSALKYYYIIAGNIVAYLIYEKTIIIWYFVTYINFLLAQNISKPKFLTPIIWFYAIISVASLKIFGPLDFDFYYPPHRALSFALDLCKSHNNANNANLHQNCKICKESAEIFTMPNSNTLPKKEEYTILNYYAYLLYPPLFQHGPMLGFHCWMRQIHRDRFNAAYPLKKVVFYGGKLLLEYFFFIGFTHVIYCYSTLIIPMNEHLFKNSFYLTLLLSIFQGLKLWFQFMFYWRFGRLQGLLDQVEAPEDLKTCFLGSYTIQGFWKDLHRSMHLWLLEYLYVPLGGNKHKAQNVFLVFAFFIITHNISWSFLAWGALTGILIVFEEFVRRKRVFKTFEDKFYGKYLNAFGTAIYLALVMSFDMAVFIMGLERVLKLFGGFFINIEGIMKIVGVSIMLVPSIIFIYALEEKENKNKKID